MEISKLAGILALFLLATYLQIADAQDSKESHSHCDKYCHMNCDIISEPDLKEQCKYTHSHESECNCHFGGVEFGVFISLGLATTLVLMCCICRHCRRRQTTNIVVVTQPETVTTITHQGATETFNNHSTNQQQQVYSIEMVPQKVHNNSPSPPSKFDSNNNNFQNNMESAVTVISSRKFQHEDRELDPNSPSSSRILFQNSPPNHDLPDEHFMPPRYL